MKSSIIAIRHETKWEKREAERTDELISSPLIDIEEGNRAPLFSVSSLPTYIFYYNDDNTTTIAYFSCKKE